MPRPVTKRKRSTNNNNNGQAGPKPSKAPAGNDRPIVYEEVRVLRAIGGKALTAEKAIELLRWQVEDGMKFGKDFLLRDYHGKKVRCLLNLDNRPFKLADCLALKQEILRGNYKLNGEPIIIGCTGKILDGQHTLCALILAAQEWEASPGKWINWQSEPTIEKIIVVGINEDDATVNTIDTGRPRSLADVVYRSEVFQDVKPKARKRIARTMDFTVRMFWERTGAYLDPHTPKRTHAESMDTLVRFPRLIEAVRVMDDLNGNDAKVTRYLTAGYSAAMLYLMACSKTDADYSAQLTEAELDLTRWERAVEFWSAIANGSHNVSALRTALGIAIETGAVLPISSKLGLIAKSWRLFCAKKALKHELIALKYEQDGEGVHRLVEHATVGGIDHDPETGAT